MFNNATKKAQSEPTASVPGADIIEKIDNDTVLPQLMNDLKSAKQEAQGMHAKLELREAELMDRLKRGDYSHYSRNAVDNAFNIDAIEESVKGVETREDLEKRLLAIKRAKDVSWIKNKEYRQAMAKYLDYITPILTELEEVRNSIAVSRYLYAVKKLFEAAEIYGMYVYSVNFSSQFGRVPRTDNIIQTYVKQFR
jgi:hypothetical protein